MKKCKQEFIIKPGEGNTANNITSAVGKEGTVITDLLR